MNLTPVGSDGFVITDRVLLRAPASEAWMRISTAEGLVSWWPQGCTISEGVHAMIHFTWQNGSTLLSRVEVLVAERVMQFTFGTERIKIELTPKLSGCVCKVTHSEIDRDDLTLIVHIAQTWSFLLCNLKSVIEHGLDLRETVVDRDELSGR